MGAKVKKIWSIHKKVVLLHLISKRESSLGKIGYWRGG